MHKKFESKIFLVEKVKLILIFCQASNSCREKMFQMLQISISIIIKYIIIDCMTCATRNCSYVFGWMLSGLNIFLSAKFPHMLLQQCYQSIQLICNKTFTFDWSSSFPYHFKTRILLWEISNFLKKKSDLTLIKHNFLVTQPIDNLSNENLGQM